MKNSWNRKKLLSTGLVAGMLGAGMGVGAYFKTPVNALTIDVNPSIELVTNRLDEVVKVKPLNEDAEQMLKGFKLDDELEDVVEDIVDRMVFTSYISGGSDNVVMLSVNEDNQNPEMVDKVNQTIAAYLEKRKVAASVLTQSVDASKKDEQLADDKNVSPGKLSLIQRILDGDKSLTFEDLSSISLKELLVTAEKNQINTNKLFDDYFIALDDSVKTENKKQHDDDKENKPAQHKVGVHKENRNDDWDDDHDDDRYEANDQKDKPKKKQTTKTAPVAVQKEDDDWDDDHDDWDDDDWDDDGSDD